MHQLVTRMHRSSRLPCCVELRGSTSTGPLIPPSRRAVHRLLTPASHAVRRGQGTSSWHAVLRTLTPAFSAAVTLPFGRHRVLLPPVHPLVHTSALDIDNFSPSFIAASWFAVAGPGRCAVGASRTTFSYDALAMGRCDHPVRSTVVGSTIFDSVVYPST